MPSQQPKLFETSQTALMLSELRTYQALTESQQTLVRAYIDAHANGGGRITKTDWINQAKKSGISRSRAYELLQDDPVSIHAAIREALQQTGETAAQYGALALYAAGLKIYEDVMTGSRPTYQLTSVELGIMRECVQSLTPARLVGVSVDSSGKTSAAVGGRGDETDMASQASSVVAALRGQLGLEGGGAATDSAAESGDGGGVASDSVRGADDAGDGQDTDCSASDRQDGSAVEDDKQEVSA